MLGGMAFKNAWFLPYLKSSRQRSLPRGGQSFALARAKPTCRSRRSPTSTTYQPPRKGAECCCTKRIAGARSCFVAELPLHFNGTLRVVKSTKPAQAPRRTDKARTGAGLSLLVYYAHYHTRGAPRSARVCAGHPRRFRRSEATKRARPSSAAGACGKARRWRAPRRGGAFACRTEKAGKGAEAPQRLHCEKLVREPLLAVSGWNRRRRDEETPLP